jgi:RNA polymerase sigma-70 factor (ECF subfamily)
MIADLDDEILIHNLKEGEIRALGDLYLRYGSMVKTALKRFAPEMGGADVDELCQDVFLALFDTIGRYEEQNRLKGWLYGIAVRKARTWRRNTWLRRRLLNRRCEEAVAIERPDIDTPLHVLEIRQEMEAALGRLSDKQREVVLLFSVEGFSCEETAEILGVEIGVVWSRLHRARQTLAKARGVTVAEGVYEGEL